MASVSSPAPSPSPTPPPLQSQSPSHHHSALHSTKSGALVSVAKSTLSEQSARLTLKHNTDLDLIEDLGKYFKSRCQIERDYAQALAKANSLHSKRSSSLLTFVAAEDEISEVKTVYTAWKLYQEESEKHSKNRSIMFESLNSLFDQLKVIRAHKMQVSKKCLDSHLKKMQEEVIGSVNEIDKTRKLYFEEEHMAKQARDKEEKIKKRKTGIFSSFANLQTKKERTSAHREASDIQSTQARNEYILALAAGNAHLQHYYEQDLPNLMYSIDDSALDKCRSFILSLLQAERDVCHSWSDLIDRSNDLMEHASVDHTNSVFLRDPNSASINETLLYEFQPCDNDTCDYISLDHNADIALRNEGQKWFTWFSKECRNLNRLSAQLARVLALQSEGHKVVEVTGSGQVDIESRIDEIRQQIRKCEISKMKAKARLQIIRESGAEVEDFESFENQVTQEIKQQSLDVDMNLASLSRTPSMRSNMGSEAARSPIPKSDPDSSTSATAQFRPESASSMEQLDSPDREVLNLGQLECNSPAPATMGAMWEPYDPTKSCWDEEPPASGDAVAEGNEAYNGYEDQSKSNVALKQYSSAEDTTDNGTAEQLHEHAAHDYEHYQQTVDGFTLVGKSCYVLYAYSGGGQDELTIVEQEIVSVIDASDKDWVRAQNGEGLFGYVPAAYLQAMPEETDQHTSVVSQISNSVESDKMSSSHDMPVFESAAILPSETESLTFPAPPPPMTAEDTNEYVRAMYDYEASNPEEISFAAGELIRIIDKSSEDGWWTGENQNGVVGHFLSIMVTGPDSEAEEEDEDEEEEDEEEEEDSTSQAASMPPSLSLPPVAPPVPSICGEEIGSEVTLGAAATLPPAAPPPSFAPPPKPMSLMAPQAVVIIQPTPEIESRPVIGSEEQFGEVGLGEGEANTGPTTSTTASSDSTTDESCVTVTTASTASRECRQPGVEIKENGELESNTITISMAIAAQEVSSAITQQAIDESMRELSRRTSASSSHEDSVHSSEIAPGGNIPNGPAVGSSGGDTAATQANGNVVQNGAVEEDEEDCK